MKKLSLLTLLLLLFIHSFAQRNIFSTTLGNNEIGTYVRHISPTQYLVHTWKLIDFGPTPISYLIFLNRKGEITRDDLLLDSGYTLAMVSIQPYNSGYLTESYQHHPSFGVIKVFTCYDSLWKLLWSRKIEDNYSNILGQGFVIEPYKRIRIISADLAGKIFLQLLDHNGFAISNHLIPYSSDLLRPSYLTKLADNSYALAITDNNSPHQYSSLLCIDTLGTILWHKPFYNDTLKIGLIEKMIVLDQYLYLKTWIQDSVTFNLHYTLHKISPDGNTILKKEYTSSANVPSNYLNSLISSKDHGLYVYFNQSDSISSFRSRLIKYDQELNQKWSMDFGEYTYAVDTASCNGIVRSFQNYDPRILPGRVEAFTDPDLEDVCNKCETTVYPNPSKEESFTIRSNFPEVFIENTEMYDMKGRLAWKNNILIDDNQFALKHNLADGIYLCRITCENGKSQVKRVVITK